MESAIKIGTRESQLAVWQASQVLHLLQQQGINAELVYIKSDGDIDLKTPLYDMGVRGIFTRSLDIALLEGEINIAVHSMKDVPTQLAMGIEQAAVLKRGPVSDLLVFKTDGDFLNEDEYVANIATSSIRRRAQWLNKYPCHKLHNLRGNINTRLKKLAVQNWDAAIFAQAGIERINLRPVNSIIIDWMLPAPAQGAIMVVCRKDDNQVFEYCNSFNDPVTALCTKIEREFLKTLLGGCSTPISALAELQNDIIHFQGNILSPDGKNKISIEKSIPLEEACSSGIVAAKELLVNGGQQIADIIEYA